MNNTRFDLPCAFSKSPEALMFSGTKKTGDSDFHKPGQHNLKILLISAWNLESTVEQSGMWGL